MLAAAPHEPCYRFAAGALKLANHHHLTALAERVSSLLEDRIVEEQLQQEQCEEVEAAAHVDHCRQDPQNGRSNEVAVPITQQATTACTSGSDEQLQGGVDMRDVSPAVDKPSNGRDGRLAGGKRVSASQQASATKLDARVSFGGKAGITAATGNAPGALGEKRKAAPAPLAGPLGGTAAGSNPFARKKVSK